jgi:hypothetical protein
VELLLDHLVDDVERGAAAVLARTPEGPTKTTFAFSRMKSSVAAFDTSGDDGLSASTSGGTVIGAPP